MRTILKIIGVEKKLKNDKPYLITTALLDTGDEARGFGKFIVGDKVFIFFDHKWDVIKMKRPRNNLT